MTPTITLTDDLVERCRMGEQRAQLEIYNKYCRAMYNIALRIVNDTAEAEDVMQEAFINAFSKINSFQGNSTFGAWLKRIVVNLALSSHNKRSRYQEVSFDEQFKKEAANEEDGVDLKEEENNKKVQKVLKAMQDLKENYRVILDLHLIEGYDQEEICDILKISPANCRTTISRAKESLRNKLRENEIR